MRCLVASYCPVFPAPFCVLFSVFYALKTEKDSHSAMCAFFLDFRVLLRAPNVQSFFLFFVFFGSLSSLVCCRELHVESTVERAFLFGFWSSEALPPTPFLKVASPFPVLFLGLLTILIPEFPDNRLSPRCTDDRPLTIFFFNHHWPLYRCHSVKSTVPFFFVDRSAYTEQGGSPRPSVTIFKVLLPPSACRSYRCRFLIPADLQPPLPAQRDWDIPRNGYALLFPPPSSGDRFQQREKDGLFQIFLCRTSVLDTEAMRVPFHPPTFFSPSYLSKVASFRFLTTNRILSLLRPLPETP